MSVYGVQNTIYTELRYTIYGAVYGDVHTIYGAVYGAIYGAPYTARRHIRSLNTIYGALRVSVYGAIYGDFRPKYGIYPYHIRRHMTIFMLYIRRFQLPIRRHIWYSNTIYGVRRIWRHIHGDNFDDRCTSVTFKLLLGCLLRL